MTLDNDLFSHLDEFRVGPHAYIVGSGPNGQDHIHQINQDHSLIALNGACQYHLAFDFWFCFDPNVCEHDWFWPHYERAFEQTIFSSKMLRMTELSARFSFQKDPNLGKPGTTPGLINGVLRGGATIAGAALQACYFAGCQAVTLVGIDMFGDRYFYPETNHKPQAQTWQQMDRLNQLIALVQQQGMTVTSLSPTALTL